MMAYPELIMLLGSADAVCWAQIVGQSRPVREWAARRRCRRTTREALMWADAAHGDPPACPDMRGRVAGDRADGVPPPGPGATTLWGRDSVIMLARLRPDRVLIASAQAQCIVPADPSHVPATVTAYCGREFRSIDIDPRFTTTLRGMPCAFCVGLAPIKVMMTLTPPRDIGHVWPSEDVDDPPGDHVYASGVSGLELRHIVPERGIPRIPAFGRMVAISECGHLVWCPRSGPWPSVEWPVCWECRDRVERQRS